MIYLYIFGGVALLILAAVLAETAYYGRKYGWGIFGFLYRRRLRSLAGNGAQYDLQAVATVGGSPLQGKRILFLGSSVTFGAASCGLSFADFLAKRSGAAYVKEAVSGTTFCDCGKESYVQRLIKIPADEHFDLAVCQLSTNDAAQQCPPGAVSGEGKGAYDTKTVCGAIETIIACIRKRWGCPVVFFTNVYYENDRYAAMVEKLKEVQKEYGIGVIDLFGDAQFNAISQEQRKLYMADSIHPTKAGYLEWWVPKMEEELFCFYRKSQHEKTGNARG